MARAEAEARAESLVEELAQKEQALQAAEFSVFPRSLLFRLISGCASR